LPPEEPSGFMKQVEDLADQAAGSVGGAISAFAVENGTELALAAGAAPGLVAAGAMAAGAALAPVAKEVVKGVGSLALNAGRNIVNDQIETFNFYKDLGKGALDIAYPNWRNKSPLELLIEIPKLTAQDIIRNLLTQEDDLTRGDTELLPIGRNVRDPPPWLPGAPEFKPRSYQPAIPYTKPESYGPSNPPPRSSSSSAAPPRAEPSSTAPPQAANYTVYNNVGEWLEKVKSKGALVEEIYKRDGWRAAMGVQNSKGYSSDNQSQILRNKLGKMDRMELARILIHLDKQAGHIMND